MSAEGAHKTSLDPLLEQLAHGDAPTARLEAEGFSTWEIMAARAIVNRARSSTTTTGRRHAASSSLRTSSRGS